MLTTKDTKSTKGVLQRQKLFTTKGTKSTKGVLQRQKLFTTKGTKRGLLIKELFTTERFIEVD